jgi:hypothetical protein
MPGMPTGTAPGLTISTRVEAPGSAAFALGDVIATAAQSPAVRDAPTALIGADAMTAMGLCLAVLAGGLLLLALLALRRSNPASVRVWLRRLPGPRVGRLRDPPSLTQLSICRC